MKKYLMLALELILEIYAGEVGAITVKPVEASATKWSSRAGAASADFESGALAGAADWARNTANAADVFHQAVTAAGVKERFRRGVVRAGAEKFARKISDVGAARYAPGVAAAEADYRTGVEPYLSTIAALTLSPRKPRGDPGNYMRVQEVGKALNAKRLAMLGGGG